MVPPDFSDEDIAAVHRLYERIRTQSLTQKMPLDPPEAAILTVGLLLVERLGLVAWSMPASPITD